MACEQLSFTHCLVGFSAWGHREEKRERVPVPNISPLLIQTSLPASGLALLPASGMPLSASSAEKEKEGKEKGKRLSYLLPCLKRNFLCLASHFFHPHTYKTTVSSGTLSSSPSPSLPQSEEKRAFCLLLCGDGERGHASLCCLPPSEKPCPHT